MEVALPSNLDAERAVLGSLLMDRDAILVVEPVVTPADFLLEKHRWVYEAVLRCSSRRIPPDLQTVGEALRAAGRLAEVGDLAFLVELSCSVPTAYHAEYYARIVAHLAYCRRLIAAGGRIASLGYESERDQADLMAAATAELQRAGGADAEGGFRPMGEAAEASLQGLGLPAVPGIGIGLGKPDQKIGGSRAGNLVIVAARPGIGKTAIALWLSYVNSVRLGKRGGIVSLEMNREELAQRMLAIASGVDHTMIRAHTLTDQELVKLSEATEAIGRAPLLLATSLPTIDALRIAAVRAAVEAPLEYLIVDYLQLMSASRRRDNRTVEVGEISRGLKQLAGELGCPIFALSQLNRGPEGRKDPVPQMSDLRESGSIENDADLILFLHRERGTSLVEIHIGKNRHGAEGVVPVFFHPKTGRWGDLEPEQARINVSA